MSSGSFCWLAQAVIKATARTVKYFDMICSHSEWIVVGFWIGSQEPELGCCFDGVLELFPEFFDLVLGLIPAVRTHLLEAVESGDQARSPFFDDRQVGVDLLLLLAGFRRCRSAKVGDLLVDFD